MSKVFPYGFIRNKIVKSDATVINIRAKAVQYGLGFFSGMRGMWSKEKNNLFIFRMEDHFYRLKESANIMGMRFPYTYQKFQKIIFDLIKKNRVKEDVYIRPTVYAASLKLTPRLDNGDDDMAVYLISLKDYFQTEKGLSACVSSWRRYDDDAISVKAKVTGSYVSSALAKTEAVANGFDEAIFLNHSGNICEASSANLFGIKDGIVYTPPLASGILNGITRRTLIDLIKNEMKMELREEDIDRSTLYAFDELFFSGTAAKVTAVTSVDRKKIGSGKVGGKTKKIKEIYEKALLGRLENRENWCTPVY